MSTQHVAHVYQGATNGRAQRKGAKLARGGPRPIELRRLERLLATSRCIPTSAVTREADA